MSKEKKRKKRKKKSSEVRSLRIDLIPVRYGLKKPERTSEAESDESEEEQKKYFPWLLSKYFKIEVEKNNGFMREFLEFEYHLRIVTTGYRSKNLKRDIGKELQFENVGDPIVAMTLAQKDTSSAYVFPYEFHDLEAAIADAGPNPTQKYDVIAEYRFNFYTKYIIDFPFTLKASLAYMMSLWILEEYFALKQDKGEVVLDQIVEKENVS